MPAQVGELVSPWQHPTPKHDAPLHQQHPTTTWQVRKPLVAGDFQSTSTVTTSASPSSSSTSTPPASNTASPLSTSNQPQIPESFLVDEYHHLDTPPDSPTVHHEPHSRALPRCAVVNFRKDGDSLRWAPRVTHNAGGVAARVHNFEDAFSLEEFSSRALPVVWRSRGGNPRLSDISKSPTKEKHLDVSSSKSNIKPQSTDLPCSPRKRFSQPVEKRTNSTPHPQRAMVRNSSVKKAVVLAAEVHRPSFWSLLAHTSKYQRSKAKVRIQSNGSKRSDPTSSRPARRPDLEEATPIDPTDESRSPVPRRQWANVTPRKPPKASRGGKATKRAPDESEKKSKSIFQRLLSHLDRRNSKKNTTMQDTARGKSVDVNRVVYSKGDSGSDSDDKTVYGDKPKSGFRQPRHSEGYSNRRVVSALTGNFVTRRGQPRREMTRVGSQDDQYVTFITSET